MDFFPRKAAMGFNSLVNIVGAEHRRNGRALN